MPIRKGMPCAAFVCWVIKEAAFNSGFADYDRYLGADAYGWEKWAAKKGMLLLPEDAPARAGDLVTFDFSHIGIVVKDADFVNMNDIIQTVEGNTNKAGEREGDGVWRKARRRELVKTFIRLE